MKKHGMMSWPIRFFCALLFSVFCASSAASTIVTQDTGVTYIQANAAVGNADLLQVRPANAHGISINRFEKFEIRDRALRLVHATGGHGSAGLVVIIADEIVLEHELVGVGPATDILFLSTDDNGSIKCHGCRFSNFNRVSLAAAKPDPSLDESAASIGKLIATSSGSLIVNSLSARGAISVDILARRVVVDGTVNTHLKAEKHFFGGYSEALNGNQLIGSGSVNVLVGDTTWNYDDQELIKVRPTASEKSVIGGEIRTVHLKVSSGNATDFVANVDTRTDVLSAVRYRGKAHVVKEGITLQSFGSSDIVVSNQLSSEGTISIRSNASLYFPVSANLQGSKIELLARNDLDNQAKVAADTLEVAAQNIRNRFGHIEVFGTLSAWAEDNIYNEFGGRIVGPTITLHSESGIIRNGSRTPYIPLDDDVDDFLGYSWVDVENPDPLRIGTYYKRRIRSVMDLDLSTASAKAMAEDHSAFIGAQTLRLKAKAVENINPYWQRLSGTGPITLKRGVLNQVTMAAENLLEVEASKYMVNSSARLLVNDPAGRMRINARVLSNERYRAMVALEKGETSKSNWSEITRYQRTSTWVTEYDMKNYAYSPPGVIVSMGDLEVVSRVGVVNNVSYLEVFGNALFDDTTPRIKDFGINKAGVTGTEVHKGPTLYCYNRYKLYGPSPAWCDRFSGYELEVEIEAPDELDSLFFVHGNAKGRSASFETITRLAIHEQVADSLLARFKRDGVSVGEQEAGLYPRRLHAEVRMDETDPNRVYVDSWYGEAFTDEKQESSSKTQTFSLIEELKLVIEKVKKAVADLFDEFMGWWD